MQQQQPPYMPYGNPQQQWSYNGPPPSHQIPPPIQQSQSQTQSQGQQASAQTTMTSTTTTTQPMQQLQQQQQQPMHMPSQTMMVFLALIIILHLEARTTYWPPYVPTTPCGNSWNDATASYGLERWKWPLERSWWSVAAIIITMRIVIILSCDMSCNVCIV